MVHLVESSWGAFLLRFQSTRLFDVDAPCASFVGVDSARANTSFVAALLVNL